ncbi:hypothetical protein FrEUN1fDRAFT_6354 [Parafrankia sp. EUN1f]|nr:hypothetical protein FrEUN1fDRAFT_6354 [Parafrankia sp. EUN1f]
MRIMWEPCDRHRAHRQARHQAHPAAGAGPIDLGRAWHSSPNAAGPRTLLSPDSARDGESRAQSVKANASTPSCWDTNDESGSQIFGNRFRRNLSKF